MTSDPTEDRLRASLTEHARHTPDADALAERIVRATQSAAPSSRRRSAPAGWRSWTLPVVAAASVVLVVAAAIGIESYQPEHHSPSTSSHVPAVRTSAAPTTGVSPTGAPSVSRSVPATSTPTSSASPPPLHDVQVVDLTFAGADDGWALGTADCLTGTGRCTAVLRTTDGRTWHGIPGARFNVDDGTGSCAQPCVAHLRFATDRIGYAYGADALFMTVDGGATWQQQPGRGADALETASGNVILVRAADSGCPSRCDVRIERALIGSTAWKAISLGGTGVFEGNVQLARQRQDVAVLTTRAGSAGAVPGAALFTSTDSGSTWTARADPCATIGAKIAGRPLGAEQVVQAPDGSLTLLCSSDLNSRRELLLTSTDAGATFSATPLLRFPPTGFFLTIGAISRSTVFAADASTLRRSTDGGRTWTAVAKIPGFVTFLGFENDHVGRMLIDGGHAIWTTRDSGRSWTEVRFR